MKVKILEILSDSSRCIETGRKGKQNISAFCWREKDVQEECI